MQDILYVITILKEDELRTLNSSIHGLHLFKVNTSTGQQQQPVSVPPIIVHNHYKFKMHNITCIPRVVGSIWSQVKQRLILF